MSERGKMMAGAVGKCEIGKVSVIMPAYNCAPYIKEAVESVVAQTYENWELIIVDDCSGDGTGELIKELAGTDSRIRSFVNPKNRGAAVSRSRAIAAASGQYVAFLDSDDRWEPLKLEKQLAFMRKVGADFSCTAYSKMDTAGNDLGVRRVPPGRTDYRKCVRLSNPIGNSTVIYDQSRLGKFRVPDIRKRNDFALWLQILKKTDCCYGMEEVLCHYRIGLSDSVSGDKSDLVKYHWQLYRRIEGHGVLRSLYEVGCWAFVKGTGIGLSRAKGKKQR